MLRSLQFDVTEFPLFVLESEFSICATTYPLHGEVVGGRQDVGLL